MPLSPLTHTLYMYSNSTILLFQGNGHFCESQEHVCWLRYWIHSAPRLSSEHDLLHNRSDTRWVVYKRYDLRTILLCSRMACFLFPPTCTCVYLNVFTKRRDPKLSVRAHHAVSIALHSSDLKYSGQCYIFLSLPSRYHRRCSEDWPHWSGGWDAVDLWTTP